MSDFMVQQGISVGRIVAAAVCGGFVGCERQSKKRRLGLGPM